MPGHAVSALLFGKLPAHGDFVARGVGAAERTTLDAWLSASLAAARVTFDTTFETCFDHAHPWRAEGPGTGGAISPSQDSVGRRFPVLLLAGPGQAAACEDLLYRAIAEGWDADAIVAAADTAPQGAVTHWSRGGRAPLTGAAPSELITAMLA